MLERLARRIGLGERDLEILGRVPLFAGLEPGGLADLIAEASIRRFAHNAMLFVEGEPVVRDGTLLGADERALRRDLADRARRLWP